MLITNPLAISIYRGSGGGTTPSLSLNFTNASDTLSSLITFARASSATDFDSTGTLQTAASGVARAHAFQDYNPSTLAPLGFLIEEQRTNSIRNNTMVGASNPSTLPTNWLQANSTGLAFSIVGTGTENGIEYIDLRINGTTTGTGQTIVYFDGFTQIGASSGQTWTLPAYVKLQAGATTNITSIDIGMLENTAGGAAVTSGVQAITPTGAALRTYRPAYTRTLSGGGTVARVVPLLQVAISTGLAVDVTLRIGLPQLELGAFATSVIKTTGAAATRLADSASITGTNFSSWYNQSEGTIVASYDYLGGSGTVCEFSGGGGIDRLFLRYIATQNQVFVTDDTVPLGSIFDQTGENDSSSKTALAYKLNDYAVRTNGGTNTGSFSTNNTWAVTTLSQLNIGANNAGGGVLSGHIQSLAYYRSRLPNSTLAALSL